MSDKSPPPFVIYALPRSRTFWLSRYLAYGPWKCGHEELQHVRGLDDIKSLLGMPLYGSAETGAAPFWRLIHDMRPDIKTAVIRRPVEEVIASLNATGVPFDQSKLEVQIRRLDAKLDQIEARVPNVISVRYDEMDEAACALLMRHCTGQDHDPKWFSLMSGLRLTCDLEALIRYFHAHMPQLKRVGNLAKQRMLAKISGGRVVSEGMTYQQEPFDTFLEDGKHLFERHLIEVGEAPNAWEEKNLELMRVLEGLGMLYVTTARSNGRMFGYLMSIIAPALDHPTNLDGIHTLFYASPDAPGVGLKLQRASVEFLRGKGVNQVSFRAGPRGSGERASALYRRLGAQDAGHMFILPLKEAV